ncbi:odorant receptor 63a-like isoform X1 [Microplitis mediator]|uniref:odorant receptor 63a-like isoform X1 n=2 Tax=Microplitis mediator TaxID=375433 RepID=UPI0025537BDF|nr:odorant receptor 63a-like isoform X1 [Microplitis mediator]
MKSKAAINEPNAVHWTEDSIKSIRLYKYILQIICSWPLEQRNIYWKIRISSLFVYLMISGIFIIQELLDHCGTNYEIASLFGMIFGTISAITKISLLNIYHKNISFIVKNVINDWRIINDDNCKTIMRQYSSLNRALFYGILTPLLLYTLKFTIDRIPHTILTNDNTTVYVRTTPISSECWNLADIPTVFYIIRFACRTFEFVIYNIVSCGIDLYFLVLAKHICGQMEISNMNIQNFLVANDGRFERDKFYKLIDRQKYMLGLMDKLRESFNYITLAVLLISGIHLNIMIIMIFVALKDNNMNAVFEDATGTILYFSAQIFIYCYAGDELSTKVKNSRLAVYSCSWYNFSINTRKDIIYIMLRVNKEYHLTAGKFYYMNLLNFTNIVKTMVSFFSVMRLVIFE